MERNKKKVNCPVTSKVWAWHLPTFKEIIEPTGAGHNGTECPGFLKASAIQSNKVTESHTLKPTGGS